jgi:hypothetical protein
MSRRASVLIAEPSGLTHEHPFGAHAASSALIARPDGTLLTPTDAFHSSLLGASLRRHSTGSAGKDVDAALAGRPRSKSYPGDVLTLPASPDRTPPPPRRRRVVRRPPRSPPPPPRAPSARKAAPLGSPTSVAAPPDDFPAFPAPLALEPRRGLSAKRLRAHAVDELVDELARVSTQSRPPPFAFVDTCRVAPTAKRLRSHSVDEIVAELTRVPRGGVGLGFAD